MAEALADQIDVAGFDLSATYDEGNTRIQLFRLGDTDDEMGAVTLSAYAIVGTTLTGTTVNATCTQGGCHSTKAADGSTQAPAGQLDVDGRQHPHGFQELVGQLRDGDVEDVHLVLLHEVEEQVERAVLTGSRDNTAKLWDAETGKEILSLPGHTQEVTSVSFSPDGRNVLTSSRDGKAIVWLAIDWRGDGPHRAVAER